MKFSTITALLAVTVSVFAAPVPDEAIAPEVPEAPEIAEVAEAPEAPEAPEAQAASQEIPGYDQRQSNNAYAIIKEIKAEKFGKDALTACKIVFATAIVESNIYIYANENVPASKEYHHDKVGSDHDSVGIFQQRAKYYPLAAAMSPAKSARMFFAQMKTVQNWKLAKKVNEIGIVAQKVQVSGESLRKQFPDFIEDALLTRALAFSLPRPVRETCR